MKIKTSELVGVALDWAVAKCEGFYGHVDYRPTTNWAQGGPIIERGNITIIRADNDYVDGRWVPKWFAETSQWVGHSASESYERQQMSPTFMISAEDGRYAPTPLVAAMRCFVACKLGDEVDMTNYQFDGN